MRAVPGVEQVALSSSLPLGGGVSVLSFQPEGKPEMPPNQQPLSFYVEASPGYFSTMGIPVLRGREFDEQDAVENPRAILINEAMARREFPDADPIGRRFSFGPGEDGKPAVGGDCRRGRQRAAVPRRPDPVPMIYAPNTASPGAGPEPDDPHGRRSAWRPPAPFAPRCSRSTRRCRSRRRARSTPWSGASLTQRKFNMTLLIVFAGIALVLAIAGIYGTVAYSVAQRTQEIGIRVALGAQQPRDSRPGAVRRVEAGGRPAWPSAWSRRSR